MAQEKTKKPTNPVVKQWIIPIAVLVVICLVCVGILALLNDLLYVAPPSADDIYKELLSNFERDTEFDEKLNDEYKSNKDYGQVLSVVRDATEGAFILEVVSNNVGYLDGTVTLYVAVSSEAKVLAWKIKENTNQSYINNIPSDAGTSWYVGSDITAEISDFEGTGTGATKSATAIYNAINMAAYYCRTALKDALGLGEIKDPAKEAQNAALALLSDTDYSGYTLTRFSFTALRVSGKTYADTLKADDDVLSYIFEGKGNSGVVYVYVFGEGDNLKLIALTDGVLVAKSNNVAETDGIYVNVMKYSLYYVGKAPGENGAVIATAIVDSDSDAVVYTVESFSPGYVPSNYKLTVTIENGVVTDIKLVTGGNGFEEGEPDEDDANALLIGLKGATLDNIDDLYSDGVVTDASQSANLITAAVKAALAHYEANFAN